MRSKRSGVTNPITAQAPAQAPVQAPKVTNPITAQAPAQAPVQAPKDEIKPVALKATKTKKQQNQKRNQKTRQRQIRNIKSKLSKASNVLNKEISLPTLNFQPMTNALNGIAESSKETIGTVSNLIKNKSGQIASSIKKISATARERITKPIKINLPRIDVSLPRMPTSITNAVANGKKAIPGYLKSGLLATAVFGGSVISHAPIANTSIAKIGHAQEAMATSAMTKASLPVVHEPRTSEIELLIGSPYTNKVTGEKHPYGHVALKIKDKVYDYGRYGKHSGPIGEGILREWDDAEKYIASENATGRTTKGFKYYATEKEAESISKYFGGLKKNSSVKDIRKHMKAYKLNRDYNAAANNCVTVSLGGIISGMPNLGKKLNSTKFQDFSMLSVVEAAAMKAAITGDSLVIPANLQAAAESMPYAEKNIYSGKITTSKKINNIALSKSAINPKTAVPAAPPTLSTSQDASVVIKQNKLGKKKIVNNRNNLATTNKINKQNI